MIKKLAAKEEEVMTLFWKHGDMFIRIHGEAAYLQFAGGGDFRTAQQRTDSQK